MANVADSTHNQFPFYVNEVFDDGHFLEKSEQDESISELDNGDQNGSHRL